MSIQAITWAMTQTLRPTEKLALIYLADNYHPSSTDNNLDLHQLASFCGISASDADCAVSNLLDAGLVAVRGRRFFLNLPPQQPSPAKKDDPQAFVYVLGCGGLVKIGITKHLTSRVTSIQTSNPTPVTLLHHREAPLSIVRAWERCCHKELSAHRRSGEWFSVDHGEAIALVERMEEQVV